MLYIPRIERQKDELNFLRQQTYLLKEYELNLLNLDRQRRDIDLAYMKDCANLDLEYPHIAETFHASS